MYNLWKFTSWHSVCAMTLLMIGWMSFNITSSQDRAAQNRIVKFDLSTNKTKSFGIGEFYGIGGMALDGSKNKIYASDVKNNRIHVLDLHTNTMKSFGQKGSGDGQFNEPYGLAMEGQNLYIADHENHRIQKTDLDGKFLSSVSFIEGFGNLKNPVGIELVGSSLYVTDYGNDRIVPISLAEFRETFNLNNDQKGKIMSGSDILQINPSTKGAIVSVPDDASGTAEIMICGDAFTITLDAGDSILARCGSAIVEVRSGQVDVQLELGDSKIATTTLDSEQGLRFDPDTMTVTNLNDDEDFKDILIDVSTQVAVTAKSTESIPTENASVKSTTSSFSTAEKKKNGSSSCSDCIPPTLGVDKDGKRMVDNGFSFEGHAVDVRHFFTPYPLIGAQVGHEFSTTLKIYENQGPDRIKHVGLAFGLAKGEIFGDSRAMIELDRELHGEEFAVSVHDPENTLENVYAETKKGACMDDEDQESSQRCLIVTIHHTFRESMESNMVSTYVWDFHLNGLQNYYNHGIHVMGESLNPPEEYDGYHKGQMYHLVETGKTTATDQDGNTWSLIRDQWEMDYIPTKKIDDGVTMHGFARENVRFETYKAGQILLAENTLHNQVLRGEDIVNDGFYDKDNYDTIHITGGMHRSEDPVLQADILREQQRAQETFEREYWKQS